MHFHRGWVFAVLAAIVPVAAVLILLFVPLPFVATREETAPPPKPEAPPDLEKLRPAFVAGFNALAAKDGVTAAKELSSFSFGVRAVEEYRLYLLALAHQRAGDLLQERTTLSALWQRSPRLVASNEIGLRLAAIYAQAGDWSHVADVGSALGARSDVPAVAGTARWQAVQSALIEGDLAVALDAGYGIAVKSPRAVEASEAIEIIRAFTGTPENGAIPLHAAQRLERAVALMRDGDPQHALEEMNALEASGTAGELRLPLQLNRGLALNQLHRYEESNKLLEPLAAGWYKFAIPAIYTASKNYRVLASSINPIVIKTITVRQKVGTVRVKAKGKKKAVVRPKYANVKKNIQLVDLAKKAKQETYARLSTERLKDLLQLPLADEVRIEVLNTLINLAEAKNQDAYEQELIPKLAALDPSQEAGLQHLWDKGWNAYARGDYNGALPIFTFVRDTYRNPNVRRQAQYWYARTIEKLGQKEEAVAIYRNLAGAPYADVYAVHAASRGAVPLPQPPPNPLKISRPDWRELAEQKMPAELRLAYELTALTDFRDARLEIQKNMNRANQPYADALMAEIYNSSGDMLLVMRSLRRAFPQLATVEQDAVPSYFLRMYYPVKYTDQIIANAAKNGLDPYVIMGLIHQESYYNPKARSAVGATGLMQLMPPTGKELASRLHTSSNLENPATNIKLGTYYFRLLVNMFGGSVNLAIAAYNAGQGNVLRWRRAAPGKPMDEFLESIPFPETRNYVKRINMLGASYKRLMQ